jgi:hypothetical protein
MALSRRLTEREQWPAWLANDVLGAALGCALGGLLIGLVGAQWFGLRDRRPIDSLLVFAAALLGSAVVLYDTGGRVRSMIRYCLIPLPFSAAVAWAGLHFFQLDLSATSDPEAYFDGAKFGLVVGLVMGLQIGLGLFLYRRRTWPREDPLRDRPASA